MRKNKRWMAGMMAAVIGMTSLYLPAETVCAEETETEYIVVAKDAKGYDSLEQNYEEEMVDISDEADVLEENHMAVLELTEAEALQLENDTDIVMVEEDILLSANGFHEKRTENFEEEPEGTADEVPADSMRPEYEWNLQAVRADGSEDDTVQPSEAEPAVKVAVLDSGVDYVSGIDLSGSVNFVEEDEDISVIFQDMTGHGTAIASIIAGNGENGIYGIDPDAQLYSVKVMDRNNQAPLSRIIRGIYWCIDNDINIINMSFGTAVYSQIFEQAVQDAYDAGILMVAAAGNDGSAIEYPAAFPQVMAVAATGPDAQLSEFSNAGEELDVAAPGEMVRAAGFFDGTIVTHGTSIAAPHVTGAAARLWEKDLGRSNDFIRRLIDNSAADIRGTDDCGLLDVSYASEMYDAFAEEYEAGDFSGAAAGNEMVPQTFEEIRDDETYVEGRWWGSDHIKMIDNSSHKADFTEDEVRILKFGCVYPDNNEAWSGSKYHPHWHGKWKNTNGKRINYIAVFELVTRAAIDGQKVKDSLSYQNVWGMDQETFSLIKGEIKNMDWTSICKMYNFSNTKRNRKLFLYACGIHVITDAFAHSTTRLSGKEYNKRDADDKNEGPGRDKIALRVTNLALNRLNQNYKSSGKIVLDAIEKECPQNPEFKMINIKRYLKENGHTGKVLDKINLDK